MVGASIFPKLGNARWYEREQTRVGVESVKSWAQEPGNIDPDDLFVSGNADEVLHNSSSHVFSLVQGDFFSPHPLLKGSKYRKVNLGPAICI